MLKRLSNSCFPLILFGLSASFACGQKEAESKVASSASKTAPQTIAPKSDTSCGPGLDMAPGEAVAMLNGQKITCKELMQRSGDQLLMAESEYHYQRRALQERVLAELINDRLLKDAAKAAGQGVEEFVAGSVKIQPLTDDELKAFYDKAVASGEKLPPFDTIKTNIREFLHEQKKREALGEFRKNLRQKAQLSLELPVLRPPRIELPAGGVAKGPENAPITLVEYSDFQCGFCAKSEATIAKILADYPGKIRFEYRDYPLPSHPEAVKAAEATHCAGEQGKYWEMHTMLFENQGALDLSSLKAYGKSLELKVDEFESCLDEGKKAELVQASLESGASLGINGTPAFFLNGMYLSGAQPYSRFKELIELELEEGH